MKNIFYVVAFGCALCIASCAGNTTPTYGTSDVDSVAVDSVEVDSLAVDTVAVDSIAE